MANTRPRLAQAHVLAIRAGQDRGGQPRTWNEVAEHLQLTTAYVKRVAYGAHPRKPQQVFLDPRTVIPALSDRLNDEAVQAWNRDPRCLCGCGAPTKQETGYIGRVPFGCYRMFLSGHDKRMPWAPRMVLTAEQERRRRRNSNEKRHDSISATVIAGMMRDWRTRNTSYRDLADKCGINEAHLRSVANGRRSRITTLTAARILTALDEPMRPELIRVYRVWSKSAQTPGVRAARGESVSAQIKAAVARLNAANARDSVDD